MLPWVERPAVMLFTSTSSTAHVGLSPLDSERPSFQALLLPLSGGHYGLGSGQVESIPPLSCHQQSLPQSFQAVSAQPLLVCHGLCPGVLPASSKGLAWPQQKARGWQAGSWQ